MKQIGHSRSGSLSARITIADADGTTSTFACRFCTTSFTVMRRPFQSCVFFWISSPIFLGERPSGPTFGASADAAWQSRLEIALKERENADLQEQLRELRAHGVRWLNMRKNIPFGQYAFNWLQQRLLPEGYRAPKGTYKAFGGTPT